MAAGLKYIHVRQTRHICDDRVRRNRIIDRGIGCVEARESKDDMDICAANGDQKGYS